ncbi:gp40 head vertex assembly chaperone [Escherichia phage RB69]|uniref:Gp40 head vertex assembly chaperone n=1 Tax=Escherichia phage RB69 TaxID=12353 RepID=Q7Y595_BPR69|nr:head vertex assembly chaperone [Escherichia phage RB69]AAP75945.1 gp40 head vertex assembly chaperone [Escherichia phage RB69]
MNNLDDLNLEIVDESPSSEGEDIRKERVFNESLKIIRSAMENVIQEILITLEDGSHHISLYYKTSTGLMVKSKWTLQFLTRTEKAELAPHVEKCVTMQVQQAFNERAKKKFKFF